MMRRFRIVLPADGLGPVPSIVIDVPTAEGDLVTWSGSRVADGPDIAPLVVAGWLRAAADSIAPETAEAEPT